MKQFWQVRATALILMGTLLLAGCENESSSDSAVPPVLYQISTINALLSGLYDGSHCVEDVQNNGDFGLGTFNGIDGEMVVLDGTVYQVKSDGNITTVSGTLGVPFASVHFFKADDSALLEGIASYAELKEHLSAYAQCRNYPCAFKIEGLFSHVKTRSAPKASKPYPPLADHITRTQNFFIQEDVNGTLLGYTLPEYFDKFNVPGPHFHFLSDDRKFGGHMLEVAISGATISVQKITDLNLELLRTDAFSNAVLHSDNEALEQVEK